MFAALSCHYLLSQAAEPLHPPILPSKPEDVAKRFSGAEENRWRLTTVDPTTQVDTVPPSIRATRNAYWRQRLQWYRNVEKSGFLQSAPSQGMLTKERILDAQEIWVIATFDHFKIIPIDPDFNLFYTEMSFKINQVIHQPPTSSISPGMLFDMEDEGGQIRKPNGEIETWRIEPCKYYPQPSHTYLMHIAPGSADTGDLYWFGERWDVSTDKAIPDSYDAVIPTSTVNVISKINGMTTKNAISYLKSEFSINSSK